jgi:hypothetical protein
MTSHDGSPLSDRVALPAPTPWPMVVGLGITLAFAGLVTHGAVSVVGIVLALIGGIGWGRDVLPEESVEHVALPPLELREVVVGWPTAPVDLASVGGGTHRARLPLEVPPYSSGIRGGIVGGIAMAVLALVYGLFVQQSAWYPINLLSAVAMPSLAHASVAELRAFNLVAFVTGVIVHGVLSVLVGLLYAVILPMLPRRHMLWGGVIVPLLWTGLVWALLGIVDPALDARVDWRWFVVSQIAFGLAAGFVVARARPLATMQRRPLAERAGLE